MVSVVVKNWKFLFFFTEMFCPSRIYSCCHGFSYFMVYFCGYKMIKESNSVRSNLDQRWHLIYEPFGSHINQLHKLKNSETRCYKLYSFKLTFEFTVIYLLVVNELTQGNHLFLEKNVENLELVTLAFKKLVYTQAKIQLILLYKIDEIIAICESFVT